MSNSESGLQYDELGFLIGLKQTGRDVAKIDKNVEQIRDILLGLHKELEHQYSTKSIQPKPKLSALEQALINAQNKPVELDDLIKDKANSFVQSAVVLDRVAKTLEELIAESDTPKKTENKIKQTKPRAVEISSTEDLVREFGNSERKRDENGRFVGSSKETQSTVRKVAQTLGAAIKDVMPSNPQGVDPTLDAINEVSTVLSPVKRAAGFMLRPLTGFMKSRKRNEPLPKEQADHNKKQVKLLQRIADNLQSKGGLLGGIGKLLGAGGGIVGGLLGSLGGLFKKGGKGLSKILKFGKGIPVIGALLTAMSFSGWDKKNTKEKGGTVGSAVGGIAGGALGSLLGPLGTIAGAAIGSWVGEKLGGIVAPYVKEWTDSLINADIPSTIKKGWDGFIDLVSKAFDVSPVGAAIEVGKSAVDWIKEKVGGGKFNPSDLLRKQYGGSGLNESNPVKFGDAANSGKLEGTTAAEKTKSLLRKHEGFSQDAYWDVNAYRIGYGSDTITDENGNIKRVTKKSKVTKEDAERDLVRRSEIFAKEAREKVGASSWDKLPEDTQAALTSVAYNYGSLPKRVVKAVQTGDLDKISDSVRGLEVHNNGVNKNRRNNEADIIKNSKFQKPSNVEPSKNVKESNDVVQNTDSTMPKSAIAQQAESTIQKAKNNTSVLNMQSSVTPVAARSNSLATSYTPPKIESKIQPAKEYLTSPKPQEVVVKNQNNGTINQNVSNRMLAHAITGGLGQDKWNG
ncbi:hypothetical protein F959_01637 [Acinetobacter venetianus RAG-1 = CIP 110063]|uniref:Lysozyme n=1 Tax=Acinetobacter venetianus (strain ATCC 31012 / DSM 23050 / BCRC 14357 / CCUG 45561 / CIP 110063 / KCTC 2702 / LMG 19082 / RAG-1) TaxID=1191460 RepID=N8ZZ67_ACIVR|nr:hypothetical protein [Acinetobacter venetianus]ENV36830.1 hypothetical protein F959_01637 [Acinetobacter venetianus RAG-1 = CIP 110063]